MQFERRALTLPMSVSISLDFIIDFEIRSVILPVNYRDVAKGTGYAIRIRATYVELFIYVVVFKPVDELRRMENALKYRVEVANNACCIR